MAQVKTFSWTNPAAAVARNLDCGFDPVEVTSIDTTNGGSWTWFKGMADASYLDVDAGTITLTNGVTPLAQSALFGAAISGFTLANPGVITASDVTQMGIVAGDTIKVTGIADDAAGTATLNGEYVVASVTATTITTATNTTGFHAWVSGGFASRVSDVSGAAVPTENLALRGLTMGTGVVGANDAVMVAIAKGDEPVA